MARTEDVGPGASVLIVAEDDDMRQMLVEHLSEHTTVTEATDALQALEAIRRHRPAVIVVDLAAAELLRFRAGMNALDLGALSVIVIRGLDERGEPGGAAEAPFALRKPFTLERLDKAIGSRLDRPGIR